jgi:hypothetical protein
MLASFTLISLLQTPILGQAGGLAIGNAHLTYGMHGPARTDTTIRPGDSLGLSFDIQGISVDAKGKASYSLAVEVTDAAGKVVIRQMPRTQSEVLVLGGDTVPAYAQVDLSLEAPAGMATLSVIVTDLASKKTATTTQKFTVGAKEFDVVRIGVSGDPEGFVPIVVPATGQPYFVHGAIVGFNRNASKLPKVSIDLSVLDENGKALVDTPMSGTIEKDVPPNATSLPFRFFLPLTRPGKYTVVLTSKDLLKSSTATEKFSINVVSAK